MILLLSIIFIAVLSESIDRRSVNTFRVGLVGFLLFLACCSCKLALVFLSPVLDNSGFECLSIINMETT